MPLDEGLLIAMKGEVVELTATVSEPGRDTPDEFGVSVRNRLREHQLQVMTDPTILDPPDVEVASTIESRDVLPDGLKDVLLGLGFTPQATEHGGRDQKSMFSRLQRKQRTQLDRWRTVFLRAADLSERLGELEEAMLDDVPDGSLAETSAEASHALIDGARTFMRLLLTPSLDSLEELERTLLKEKSDPRGRWVMHPALVRCLAAFVAQTVLVEAPGSQLTEDEDAPLWIRTRRGQTVRSDPEFRVAQFVVDGRKAMLSEYVRSAFDQS